MKRHVPALATTTVVAVLLAAGAVHARGDAGIPLVASDETKMSSDGGAFPAKLLITEVCTLGSAQEFVEIANPGSVPVDLSHYYLTDAVYVPSNQVYWRITEGNPSLETIGGGAFNDFHARFPDGFTIAAGDTIVVSIAGANAFLESYGFPPDLELWNNGDLPNSVPDMRWVFGDGSDNSIVDSMSFPGLTNSGEIIVLYHWDGTSDGVTDIDVFHWKDPSASSSSFLFDKTGVTIGSHSYLPETPVGEQTPFPQMASFGSSYQRLDMAEGNQVTTGGNGVQGRDETSEDLPNTFALLPADPARGDSGFPPENGDWQLVSDGPLVQYDSVAHTWGDFDRDGIDDLFLVRPGPGVGSLLIHTSAVVQVESFAPEMSLDATDCLSGDFDQDGDLDLYLVKRHATDWILTNTSGYLSAQALPGNGVVATTNAEAVDTDLDGWLEVFVSNGTGENQLLDGRFGLFDVLPYSLRHPSGTVGGAWCDIDGDRDPDLALVSATGGIVLNRQDEPRHFSQTSLPAAAAGRDLAWADFDNDGDCDFVLLCEGQDNVIHENLGNGTFAESTLVQAGPDSATGCAWNDFDNDGLSDLFVAYSRSPNVLWHNDGNGIFSAIEDTVLGNADDAGNNRAASWIDIDNDGDLDLYLSNQGVPNRIVRNNLASTNNWLQVSVAGHHWGNQSNLAAIGATIEVEAGGIVQRRYVGGGEAGNGHSPLVQHFGLGNAAVVDRVTVRWPFRLPTGAFHANAITQVVVNQRIRIEETVYGVSAVDPTPRFVNDLKGAQPNPFNPATVIEYSLENDATVDLDVFDVRGRLVRRLVGSQDQSPGHHRITWRGETDNGAEAPSGVYVYRLQAGAYTATRRLVLLR
jgi:hypothetical protein